MARTLLEDVCLHLLDRMGAPHNPKDDLPKLYHRLATLLNLAPAGHVEEIFKIILGSATSLVGALGRLRNEVGDAHGQGPGGWRPAARHATLAVNMAGGMALFLVQTWRQQGQA